MLSTSAPASTSLTPHLSHPSPLPLPYYLAFAAGGRANGQYDAIPPDVIPLSAPAPSATATAKLDQPAASPSTPIDIPTANKSATTTTTTTTTTLPHKDTEEEDDTHDPTSRGKQLSYDASTAAKEHDSHMHDTLHHTNTATHSHTTDTPLKAAHNQSSSFGQDSYFVYSRPGAAVHAVGVADGVGGWRSQGVDSGVISRAMMDKCRQQAVQWDANSTAGSLRNNRLHSVALTATASTCSLVPPTLAVAPPSSMLAGELAFPFSLPARLMGGAYDSIKEEGMVKAGSTTACVLTLTAHRCMPSHTGLEAASRTSSPATSSSDRSAPASPPSSPVLAATTAEERHQLSLDDEHKSEHQRDELIADVLVTQPAVEDVDMPLSGAASDSDEEGESESESESERETRVDVTTDATSAEVTSTTAASTNRTASLPQKTASAFWNAVGHLIDHSHSPTTSNTAATTAATSLAAPASPSPAPVNFGLSPPPSRPPSPSSPPLYLSCASIGDSGFVLFRRGRVIHRSDLQRTGRIVKQLAVIPPHLQGPIHRFCDDRPTDSTLSCHRIQAGDLLVVASDGLLDNLSAAGGGSGGRHVGFVPWARFFLTGGSLDDDSDREAIEAQNRRLEGLLRECEIDWEGGDRDKTEGESGKHSAGSGADGFVRLLCDRLVQEAAQFMATLDGKPDDVTVLVAQVCHLH